MANPDSAPGIRYDLPEDLWGNRQLIAQHVQEQVAIKDSPLNQAFAQIVVDAPGGEGISNTLRGGEKAN